MPIIRAVNGIVEMHPVLPVSPRPPATQADADNRRDHSKEQERQAANLAALLAQQAYQQQVHQAPAPKPALLAQDFNDPTRHMVAVQQYAAGGTDCDATHRDSPSPCEVGPWHVGRNDIEPGAAALCT